MISAPHVGVLGILIRKVTWKRDSWKRRADGTERPFGGLDVMFFRDFSQLKPVSGTTLASHPEVAVGSIAIHGNNGVRGPSGWQWRNKTFAWRLPGIVQSPKPVSRRPPVCVGSTNLVVSRPPGSSGSTKIVVWRSPGGVGSAKTVVWRPPGSVGPRKPIVWKPPGRSGTTWKGPNTTLAVVSKRPGDRTGANGAHRGRRSWTL